MNVNFIFSQSMQKTKIVMLKFLTDSLAVMIHQFLEMMNVNIIIFLLKRSSNLVSFKSLLNICLLYIYNFRSVLLIRYKIVSSSKHYFIYTWFYFFCCFFFLHPLTAQGSSTPKQLPSGLFYITLYTHSDGNIPVKNKNMYIGWSPGTALKIAF